MGESLRTRASGLLVPALVVEPEEVWTGGAALFHRGGVLLEAVRGTAAARRRARQLDASLEDLGHGLLTPGLVNAHSHLELRALAGQVPAQGGFGAWVGRLMELRAATPVGDLQEGVRRGARELAAGGTSCVGDIDSLGLSGPALRDCGLRVVHYREALDAQQAERCDALLRALQRPLTDRPGGTEGLAPHAPYSASPRLLRALADLARRRRLPVTVHWAETPAELQYLERGEGPLAGLLPPPPGPSGLDLLEQAGLLGPGLSLVHGNHPGPGEPERIAKAGATLVHCPGSHAFFEREPFDLNRWLRAGVPVALGTDSAASNQALDMRRELALLRRAHPELPPGQALRMATVHAARALGLDRRIGRLRPGFAADLAWFPVNDGDPEALLDALTAGQPELSGLWVAGRRQAFGGVQPSR